MKYISHRINSSAIEGIFNLPFDYKNKEVEVLIIPLDQANKETSEKNSMFGILNKFANVDLIDDESDAWSKAVMAKHGNG